MENHQGKDSFIYTYSAKEQEEVKRIREKYSPQKEDKITQLRKLDQSVTKKANITAIIIGLAGVLIMGIGMCCTMVWSDKLFILGIIIGLLGIAIIGAAYPLYKYVTKKEREKIAPKILRLTDELMK